MSLQDDYYELEENLEDGPMKDCVNRIWDAFCEMESEQEDLLDLRDKLKSVIYLVIKED